jgi:hypothetical protein
MGWKPGLQTFAEKRKPGLVSRRVNRINTSEWNPELISSNFPEAKF